MVKYGFLFQVTAEFLNTTKKSVGFTALRMIIHSELGRIVEDAFMVHNTQMKLVD
jgi:hypothetical protein